MADRVTNNKITTTVELDVDQAAIDIVKLNSLASDSTKELSDRVDAKNKQVKIQNDLNKKTISDLEKQVKGLENVKGKEKEYEKAKAKLVKAKLNEVKITERNSKAQAKLTSQYGKSKGAVNKLNKATGGMIDRLKLLAANPIVLFVTILVGALTLLKEAFTSSEEGQNKYAKAMAIVDALLGNLLDIVADLAEGLVDMVSKPQESIEKFGTLIKENIVNRFNGLMELLPQLGKAIGLLFDGEFSEAGKVAANAVAKVGLGVEDIVGKIEKATEAVKEFVKEQEKEGAAAGRVADMRAKADKIERALVVSRSKLESKIAEARLKAKKEDEFSAAERKVFLLEAQKLEDELINKETEYLELRRDAQVLENTFSRSNKENLDKEAAAIAAVNLQQAKRARASKKIQTELNTVTKQAATEEKRIAKEVADFKKGIEIEEEESRLAKAEREKEENLLKLETLAVTEEEKNQLKLDIEAKYKEDLRVLNAEETLKDQEAQLELDEIEINRLRSLGERTAELELELLEKRRLQDVSVAGLSAKEIEVIDIKAAASKKKIGDAVLAAEKAKDKAILDSAIGLAGDAFGISKELALVEMAIAAPKAIGSVWEQAAKKKTIPGMIAHGVIGTATTLAPIIKGVGEIKKARFSKSKGGAGGGGGNISSTLSTAQASVGTSEISDLESNNASRLGADTSLSSNATSDAINNLGVSGGGSSVSFYEGTYQEFRNGIEFRDGHSTIGG